MVNLPVDGFDRDIRIGLDGNGVLGAIDDDLVLPGLIDHFDGLVAGFVVEPDNVAAARLDSAVIVFAVRVGLRGIVLAIPERTQDVRMIDLAMLEGHQHLIVDLGKEVRAPALSRHGRRDSRPMTFHVIAEPWETHFDPMHVLRILIIRNDPDNHAVESVALNRRRKHRLK